MGEQPDSDNWWYRFHCLMRIQFRLVVKNHLLLRNGFVALFHGWTENFSRTSSGLYSRMSLKISGSFRELQA